MSATENLGLKWAGIVLLICFVVLIIMVIPLESKFPLIGSLSIQTLPIEQYDLIKEHFGSVGFTHAPFFQTNIIVTALFFLFFLPSLAYGVVVKK